jgi:hypothetical protein
MLLVLLHGANDGIHERMVMPECIYQRNLVDSCKGALRKVHGLY